MEGEIELYGPAISYVGQILKNFHISIALGDGPKQVFSQFMSEHVLPILNDHSLTHLLHSRAITHL